MWIHASVPIPVHEVQVHVREVAREAMRRVVVVVVADARSPIHIRDRHHRRQLL